MQNNESVWDILQEKLCGSSGEDFWALAAESREAAVTELWESSTVATKCLLLKRGKVHSIIKEGQGFKGKHMSKTCGSNLFVRRICLLLILYNISHFHFFFFGLCFFFLIIIYFSKQWCWTPTTFCGSVSFVYFWINIWHSFLSRTQSSHWCQQEHHHLWYERAGINKRMAESWPTLYSCLPKHMIVGKTIHWDLIKLSAFRTLTVSVIKGL